MIRSLLCPMLDFYTSTRLFLNELSLQLTQILPTD